MKLKRNSIPLRKTSAGDQIETRPLYVEEWLDSLPYIDFQKTSQLLYEASKATNQQDLKPSVRLELATIYNRPYQYYLDSQIKTGAQHTLQSIETMQSQINILKHIAVNLSYACKLVVQETLIPKTMWRHSKPPLSAMLMSLNYLSHALIFSFLEYAPVPKSVWTELNFIYDFAEGLGQKNASIVPVGGDPKKDTTTIEEAYKRIAMASLVDPHHLPFGAIWEIFEQLKSWSEYTQIKVFGKPDNPAGYFVIDLESDTRPTAYIDFKATSANRKHRLIDAGALGSLIKKHLDLLESGQRLDDSVQLSAYFAKSILSQMSRTWSLPPKRYSPRQTQTGVLNLACGLNSIYFYLNDEQEFISPDMPDSDDMTDEFEYRLGQPDITVTADYETEQWQLVNQGPGGFAVTRHGKPRNMIRVGDLVGISHAANGSAPSSSWAIGVIRWLMIKKKNIYKIGIQTIAVDIFAAAVRATSGRPQESQFRRAFIAGETMDSGVNSIITSKGLFKNARELEINYQNEIFRVYADSLTESSISFEHFVVNQHAV